MGIIPPVWEEFKVVLTWSTISGILEDGDFSSNAIQESSHDDSIAKTLYVRRPKLVGSLLFLKVALNIRESPTGIALEEEQKQYSDSCHEGICTSI